MKTFRASIKTTPPHMLIPRKIDRKTLEYYVPTIICAVELIKPRVGLSDTTKMLNGINIPETMLRIKQEVHLQTNTKTNAWNKYQESSQREWDKRRNGAKLYLIQ